jgi:hypothetical protein
MPLTTLADLERRIRRLEMERDQQRHKIVAPERTVNTDLPPRPVTGGSGGVTDHGALTGLSDDDHPQYLLTTGKAADSDKLDGKYSSDFASIKYADATYLGITAKAADADKLDVIDSTGFATASHDHDAAYLGITAKAADADKLDNIDSTGFVQTSGAQSIAGIKTFSSIPVLPASDPTGVNEAVRKAYIDDLLTRYAVRAYRDNTEFQLTTSGTIYTIPLNQETYDTHAQHDLITNNSRLVCVKAGMYLINATLTFAANATGNRDLLLMKNGTTYFAQQRLVAFASGSCTLNAFAAIPMAVGDYVEMRGRQYSGGALSLYYADDTNNYLAMASIRAYCHTPSAWI